MDRQKYTQLAAELQKMDYTISHMTVGHLLKKVSVGKDHDTAQFALETIKR